MNHLNLHQKGNRQKYLRHISFCSKAVELVKPPAVFNNINTKSILSKSIDIAMSTVIYELTRLISSDFFNFHKFISELNTDDFVPFFYKGPSTVKRRRLILTRRRSRESNKKSKPAVELSQWREKVFKQVEEKAANLKVTSKVQSFSNLHDNFVITQTDQANGNVAIICKFYILTLIKELGSNKTSNVH